MNPEVKLLLYKILKGNGNITELTEYGYQYSQILSILKELLSEGFLFKQGSEILLTEKGMKEIDDLNKILGRKGTNQWIEPENKSKILKFQINDVYLPSQNDLYF
jgi:predicted transcriptional regulator